MRFATLLLALLGAGALCGGAAPRHVRGDVTRMIDGRPVTVTVDREGARELVRTCVRGVCGGTWFDGSRSWTFGINEILVPETRAAHSDALVEAARGAGRPIDGALTPPPGVVPTFDGDGTLALVDTTIPIVGCTLGGRTSRCLLDSGTTPSAITLRLAEALGLEPQGEIEISAFGRYATGIVQTGPLVVGPAHFAGTHFAVAPVNRDLGFDVIVGADLLARMRVVFERPQSRARISAPSRADTAGIALLFHDGVPTVAAQVGENETNALLDTGDAATISMGYEMYRRGTPWPVVARGGARGIAGVEDTLEVALPSASIGTLALGPTRAIVRRTELGVHVGVGLWSRCSLDLDEAAERMRCTPPPNG